MEKNAVYNGKVSALGTEGEGIINYEGTTAFVPFCLVGEDVDFKALKVKGGIAYGKAEKINLKSGDRVDAPCPVFDRCGGCNIQHMNYAAQLEFKKQTVSAALKKIGGIEADVNNCVPCERQFRYRNKLSLPIGVGKNGETACGFYARHSHRIVETDDCLIQSEWVKTVIAAIKKFAKLQHITGYNEETGEGTLRRIVVREIKNKFIFALVAVKKIDCGKLIAILEENFNDFTFLLNVNSSKNNTIFSKEWHICRGFGFFEAEDGGIKYKAGANTFLQVNDDVRVKLYEQALKEADSEAVALDLYSGGGMLTAMLAKKCEKAYGIEIVEEASRCADELKKANGLDGRMFNVCGKVEEKLGGVLEKTKGNKRVIVCDPPRKGMERSVVRAVAESGADKIILISCNPATLARDLGLLTGALVEGDGGLIKSAEHKSNYKIIFVTPFDMFPQTKWCETLCVLEKIRG